MASRLSGFVSELRRRRVTRVAIAYAVVGIGVAEVGQLLFEALELPMEGWQVLVVLVLLGFPLALVLAWALELTPDGVRWTRPAPADPGVSRTPGVPSAASSRKLYWGSVAGWALAAGLLAWTAWQAFAPERTGASVVSAVSAVGLVDDAIDRGAWIEAYRHAMALPPEVPDSTRAQLVEVVSDELVIGSVPEGVTVSWRPLGEPDVEWELLGETPHAWRSPRVGVQFRYELEGYATLTSGFPRAELRRLDEPLPWTIAGPGMSVDLTLADSRLALSPTVTIGPFLIDRFEVTNEGFMAFVADGGYERRDLWEQTIDGPDGELSWDDAMAQLVDRTGRPGPSTWSGGTFPAGHERHPVTGISWYEAMAYANWAGRELPTLYHWEAVARPLSGASVVPLSNFDGEGPAPVGSYPGVTLTGASDMAGNAREWLINPTGSLRYTAGGGWSDPPYLFGLYQPQPPLDRSDINGMRLISNLGDAAAYGDASAPLDFVTRDFLAEEPVSDEVFAAFAELYDYDELPLNAIVEAIDTVAVGIRERITFDSGYGPERMILYLVRPITSDGPIQTVVFFPGSNALRSSGSAAGPVATSSRVSMLVRSGRAVAFPVLEGTYERPDDYEYRLQDPSNDHRDHVFHWRQDLGRSLDYLETRADVDAGRFAYFGLSWGGRMGAIMLAVEPRFRAAVLMVPGLSPLPTQPVVEPHNFVSRVTLPVLMLSGEFDNIYPLETSARPFYELLGTPAEHKRHYIAVGGHSVPDVEVTRETLDWLDRYLGPVR